MKKCILLIKIISLSLLFSSRSLAGPGISAGYEPFPPSINDKESCNQKVEGILNTHSNWVYIQRTSSGNVMAESTDHSLLAICDVAGRTLFLSIATYSSYQEAQKVINTVRSQFK